MNLFCVTGASGFIGSHLVQSLVSRPEAVVRILTRKHAGPSHAEAAGTRSFVGDLRDIDSLRAFVERDATVIHLAQFHGAPVTEQISTTENLISACLTAGVRRFLYVSTSTVVGRTNAVNIAEDTPCYPASDYELKKFAIETLLTERLSSKVDFGILRPTAVFGAGGQNLVSLVRHLEHGSRALLYLRRALYGRRSMNLVALENVVAAIEFLATSHRPLASNVFLVSDDHEALNNYLDVERILTDALIGVRVPPTPVLPRAILRMILAASGRSQTNPNIKYANAKLREWGFEPATALEPALIRFAQWHKAQTERLAQASPS